MELGEYMPTGFIITLSYMMWSGYSSVCLHAGEAKNTVTFSPQDWRPQQSQSAAGGLKIPGSHWSSVDLGLPKTLRLMLVNSY